MSDELKLTKKQLWIIGAIALIFIIGVVGYYNWDKIKPDKTLAEVNGDSIKLSEVEKIQAAYEGQTNQKVNQSIVLNQLVSRALLIQEAKSRGLTSSPEEAENLIVQKLNESGSNLEQFKQLVKESNQDYNELLAAYQDQVLLDKLINELSKEKNIMVNESEIRDFYNKNPSLFKQGTNILKYEEVKDNIQSILLQQKQSTLLSDLIEELKKTADIKYY